MGARANKAISRLLDQFSDTNNLTALITALAARFEDTDIVLEGLLLYRTINTAEGVWLDQVGDILGLPRPAVGVPDNEAFTLKSVGDPDNADLGLSSLGAMDGGKLSYASFATDPSLATDTVYREYLFGKANATTSDVTVPAIDLSIKNTFATESIVDSPSTEVVTIELVTALTGSQRRIVEQYAPVKAGVYVEITNWP
jgi:hypothetical protein